MVLSDVLLRLGDCLKSLLNHMDKIPERPTSIIDAKLSNACWRSTLEIIFKASPPFSFKNCLNFMISSAVETKDSAQILGC